MNKKKHMYLPIFLALVILMVGTAFILALYSNWQDTSIEIKNTLAAKKKQTKNKDLKTIIHESQKNVVQIEASGPFTEKTGSGFLYNSRGDIITNAHVVEDAETIMVKLANAQSYPAAIIGIGDTVDIAVLRVPQLKGKSTINLSKDKTVEIGNEVIALGSPLGLQNSVSLGIISGLDRTFNIDGYEYKNVYQISAPITHGNSGGPLIDRSTGKVIAINSAGTEDGSIGFSIPIANVIDKLNKWSTDADSKKLIFKSPTSNRLNPEQLQEDAKYIIHYFFDSIAIRDYLNAYALLGSEWQTTTSYQAFRQDYLYFADLKVGELNSTLKENTNTINLHLIIQAKIKEPNQPMKPKRYKYSFTIALENDQLKIMKGSRSLLD